MWTVNGGEAGCSGPSTTVELRQSTDGVAWSAPQTVLLGDGTQFPWHIDVIWVAERGEFWALYNAKMAGSCTTSVLYFATSPDGVHWTTAPTPLLQRGAIPEFADIVYRSALSYDVTTDTVTVFYSGARYTTDHYVWRVGVQQLSRIQLFDLVMRRSSFTPPLDRDIPLADRVSVRSIAPPLTEETAP